MILCGGQRDGVRVLEDRTVAAMSQNQMGALDVTPLPEAQPLSNAVKWWPGVNCKWGLSFMITMQQTPQGRSAGGLSGAGLANSYYWIDPARNLTGVLAAQILPLYDAKVVRLFNELEALVYAAYR